jgi:hypothetical protein
MRSTDVDYSIHLYDVPALNSSPILVATMRYCGDDFEKDMQTVSEDPETVRLLLFSARLRPAKKGVKADSRLYVSFDGCSIAGGRW